MVCWTWFTVDLRIEAERLQGAGADTRESLSEAERKVLVEALPRGRSRRPQLWHLPWKLPDGIIESWQSTDLFRMNESERAKVIVQQILLQAKTASEKLQEAVQKLATACSEAEAHEVNLESKVLEDKTLGMSQAKVAKH